MLAIPSWFPERWIWEPLFPEPSTWDETLCCILEPRVWQPWWLFLKIQVSFPNSIAQFTEWTIFDPEFRSCDPEVYTWWKRRSRKGRCLDWQIDELGYSCQHCSDSDNPRSGLSDWDSYQHRPWVIIGRKHTNAANIDELQQGLHPWVFSSASEPNKVNAPCIHRSADRSSLGENSPKLPAKARFKKSSICSDLAQVGIGTNQARFQKVLSPKSGQRSWGLSNQKTARSLVDYLSLRMHFGVVLLTNLQK